MTGFGQTTARLELSGGVPSYRVTAAKYDEMARLGILGPEDRVELIQGVLVAKMTVHAPHSLATTKLTFLLYEACGARFTVRTQQPIVLPDDSVPEPDVAVVLGTADDYPTDQPTAAQTVLVIEVSASSLAFDLGVKLALYAAAKIPEYWVVDLDGRRVHVHTLPRAGKKPGYRKVSVVDAAAVIPLALRGESVGSVAVKEFLP